jgi:hypothetical protein
MNLSVVGRSAQASEVPLQALRLGLYLNHPYSAGALHRRLMRTLPSRIVVPLPERSPPARSLLPTVHKL